MLGCPDLFLADNVHALHAGSCKKYQHTHTHTLRTSAAILSASAGTSKLFRKSSETARTGLPRADSGRHCFPSVTTPAPAPVALPNSERITDLSSCDDRKPAAPCEQYTSGTKAVVHNYKRYISGTYAEKDS